MSIIDDLLHELPEQAVSIFIIFSRFECALKSAGFISKNRYGDAGPDWNKFADALGPPFWDEVRSSGKARTLIDNPPKKQIVGANGLLEWGKAAPVHDVKSLLLAVRRVRNNLFHGGKYSAPSGDTTRNDQLLREAINILKLALDKNMDVRSAFRGEA